MLLSVKWKGQGQKIQKSNLFYFPFLFFPFYFSVCQYKIGTIQVNSTKIVAIGSPLDISYSEWDSNIIYE